MLPQTWPQWRRDHIAAALLGLSESIIRILFDLGVQWGRTLQAGEERPHTPPDPQCRTEEDK